MRLSLYMKRRNTAKTNNNVDDEVERQIKATTIATTLTATTTAKINNINKRKSQSWDDDVATIQVHDYSAYKNEKMRE